MFCDSFYVHMPPLYAPFSLFDIYYYKYTIFYKFCIKGGLPMFEPSTMAITYRGISDKLPCHPTTFIQFMLERTCCLDASLLSIYQLLRVDSQADILSYQVIQTPTSKSLEGQILTGKKLIVCGQLKQQIIYSAETATHSVHSGYFYTPFCTSIVLPSSYIPSSPIRIIPYIESVDAHVLDTQCIHFCSSLFLDVITCAFCTSTNSCHCFSPRVYGVSSSLPTSPTYFKDTLIESYLTLSDTNIDLGQLLSVSVRATLLSTRLVPTTEVTSLEGMTLSGCKLVVDMQLDTMITYTSCNCCESVYSAYLPPTIESAFIVVPCTINGTSILDSCNQNLFKVTPYIEGACASIHTCRSVLVCTSLLIDAVPY